MFEIEYKGANCVVITTKKSKLVVDPKLSLVGLKDIPTKGAVEIVTEERFAVRDSVCELVISSPGEYGIAGFDIRGVATRRHIDSEKEGLKSVMYRIEIDDTRLGILGNIYEQLSDEQLEELGVLDILILPVGGNGYTLDADGAAGLVRAIGPKVVIPIHYADKDINYEVPQSDLDLFVKEMGVPVETVPKYKNKQLTNITDNLSIIAISRS